MACIRPVPIVVVLGALLAAGTAWGTTPHTITVDGNLSDFAPDEKTAGDPANDSAYGADNELTTFYMTWDAQKLYLGFDYKIQGGAVMVLVDTGKTGGVTNLCPSSGYTGAYKANVQLGVTGQYNLMVALWADDTTPTVKPTPTVHSLIGTSSTDITSISGVQVALTETIAGNKRTGSVEAAIPWQVIYSLAGGKVPAKAEARFVGVLRGKLDGDGLGDVNPNSSAAVSKLACGSGNNLIDNFYAVSIDANGDGVPETGWSPATDQPKSDGGVPPDLKPPPDKRPPDSKPSGDVTPGNDSKTVGDGPAASDGPVADSDSASDGQLTSDGAPATADRKISKADVKKTSSSSGEGCACSAAGGDGWTELGAWGLLALVALLARRRKTAARN